jgi:hypothetical protein
MTNKDPWPVRDRWSRKQTPLARRRRWFKLEAELQLDLFADREAQAAKARAELDEMRATRPRRGSER